MNRVIPLTDDRGRPLVPLEDLSEPLHGSVVLTRGLHGTAYQRHFSDGLWHRAESGVGFTWEWLLSERNLVLIYDAELRSEPKRPGGRKPAGRGVRGMKVQGV